MIEEPPVAAAVDGKSRRSDACVSLAMSINAMMSAWIGSEPEPAVSTTYGPQQKLFYLPPKQRFSLGVSKDSER
jgi:hypothetical protein